MSCMKHEFEKTLDPYYITPSNVVQKKLELLELKDDETLFDLGCGNAKCLVMATSIASIKGVGYELRPEALEAAQENIVKAGVSEQVELREEDFFKADLSNANAVILYLTRNVLGSLSLKLEKELPIGARIVTHQFDLPAWKAEKEEDVLLKNGEKDRIYLYKKKAKEEKR